MEQWQAQQCLCSAECMCGRGLCAVCVAVPLETTRDMLDSGGSIASTLGLNERDGVALLSCVVRCALCVQAQGSRHGSAQHRASCDSTSLVGGPPLLSIALCSPPTHVRSLLSQCRVLVQANMWLAAALA